MPPTAKNSISGTSPRLWLAGLLLTLITADLIGSRPFAAVAAGELGWTVAKTSPAINRLGEFVATPYQPAASVLIPPEAGITRVYANRAYAGDAIVRTRLCWSDQTHCVDMTTAHLTTNAFQGLDPRQPIYLVHQVTHWGESFAPLYVKGNVNVWFGLPPADKTKKAGYAQADPASGGN